MNHNHQEIQNSSSIKLLWRSILVRLVACSYLTTRSRNTIFQSSPTCKSVDSKVPINPAYLSFPALRIAIPGTILVAHPSLRGLFVGLLLIVLLAIIPMGCSSCGSNESSVIRTEREQNKELVALQKAHNERLKLLLKALKALRAAFPAQDTTWFIKGTKDGQNLLKNFYIPYAEAWKDLSEYGVENEQDPLKKDIHEKYLKYAKLYLNLVPKWLVKNAIESMQTFMLNLLLRSESCIGHYEEVP